MIIDFIREHADHAEPGGLRWGVEPICRVLTEHGVEIARLGGGVVASDDVRC